MCFPFLSFPFFFFLHFSWIFLSECFNPMIKLSLSHFPKICYKALKSRKDSTSTLSLVINRVRFKKKLQKKVHNQHATGDETQKTTNFDGIVSFTLHCCYIYFHCSYLYSYYDSSRTLCIQCWVSAFHTEF
jgi:hypothetical protein